MSLIPRITNSRTRSRVATLLGLLLTAGLVAGRVPNQALAQELDMDFTVQDGAAPVQRTTAPSSAGSMSKPISITISKTLYLPPEMYGQWSVTGTLAETNAEPGMFKPLVYDIWLLENMADQVVITNPATGASAAINVDSVEGNKATFHRLVTRKKTIYFEMPTITVYGDTLRGVNINKVQYIRDGKVHRSYYAHYNLQATRISGARVKFKPEEEQEEPSFEIEEVRSNSAP